VSLALDFEKEQRRVSLLGFDVQNNHYPASANLPSNITVGLLDAFDEDLPAEHVGAYDVVHIRAFASVVKNDDPGPLLRNAYKMLKPGGFLQWDDMDGSTLKAVAPGDDLHSSTVSTAAAGDLVAVSLQSQAAGLNLKYSWLQRLGSLFEEQGFELVEQKRMDVKKELRNVMSVSFIMIHAHIARIAVRNGCLLGTDKNWEEVWTKAGEDFANGVSLTMDMVYAVGRKPA
jgi:SAM-dependent methyltransferase